MKNLILLLAVILSISACKKSSDGPTPPTGNYFKIDDDTRQLGDVPSLDISFAEFPDSDETYLNIGMKNKIANIDNSTTEILSMSISLFEGGPSNTEYKIENVSNHSPSTASITIALGGPGLSAAMTGKAGKLYITRDANNKIKGLKFENVQMNGSYEATVSCNIAAK